MKDFHLFDEVLTQMQFTTVRKVSADARFRFFEATSMELRAEGTQTLLTAGPDHEPCRMPDNFVKAAVEYWDRTTDVDTRVRERGK